MAFLSIPDSWIQVGQATKQRLFQRIKDNFDALFGAIGTLQGDDIINGFFEIVEDIAASPLRPLSWDVIEYLGGTVELDDTGSSKGNYALKCIHPGGAGNGGGEAKSDYHPLDPTHTNNIIQTLYYASQAGVHLTINAEYFDEDKLFISDETLLDLSGGVPTVKTLNSWQLTVPATARYMKVLLIGGDTDVDPGSSTNIFFDNVSAAAQIPDSVGSAAIATDAVGADEIATDAVGQSEIRVTDASGSIAVNFSTSATASLNGARWSWWTGSATDVGGSGAPGIGWGNGNLAAGNIGLRNDNAGVNGTFYWDEKYPQASPPYNLGDGDVPLFIFVLVDDSTGEILGTSVATNPTWAYHGPTDIIPHFTRSGRKYRRELVLPPELVTKVSDPDAEIERLMALRAFKKAAEPADFKEMEITQGMKNADMNICPHPFYLNDMTGKTIYLLDPVSEFNHLLAELHEDGENVRNLLLDGLIVFANEPLNRSKPDIVKVVSHKFRNTG